MTRPVNAGFTLLEVTIASALSAFTILAAMSMLKTFQRGTARATSQMGSVNEIGEIKTAIQNVFRSRFSLATDTIPVPAVPMGKPILPLQFPWEVSQHFIIPSPNGYNQSWSAATDATLGKCQDLVVRRHKPTAFVGIANPITGVENVYFVNHCTGVQLPQGTTQLFTNNSITDLNACAHGVVQFRIVSYLYFNNGTFNDAPAAAPNDPVIHVTNYPQDTLRGRNIAVCFRVDPNGTDPKNLPPFNAAGTYPKNLFVEIRAQIFSGDTFSSGHYSTAVDKFVIPIQNTNVELIPAVSSP